MTMFTDDVYFIDREIAQETALKKEKIKLHSGQLTIKNCYYDGEPLLQAPDNLIHVTISQFSEYFLSHPTRIPKHLCSIKKGVSIEKDKTQEIESIFKTLLDQLHDYIQSSKSLIMHQDTYFLDRDRAYATALNQNRVKLDHPTIDGLQICYHNGEPFEDAPANLICVSTENIYDFFVNTRFRIPYRLEFSPETTEQESNEISEIYHELLITVAKQKTNIRDILTKELNSLQPNFYNTRQYRIFIMASRHASIMPSATKYLAEAFHKLGHQVEFSIDQNEMEDLNNDIWHKKLRYDFNPHIVININHQNNDNLHDDVFNVIWWQDFMPKLLEKKSLHWRKRDIIYSTPPQLDSILDAQKAPHVHHQYFCVDTNNFKINKHIKRENKIVFVESPHAEMIMVHNCATSQKIMFLLEEMLENGNVVTPEVITQMSATYGLPIEVIRWKLYQHTVRKKSVQWLCKNTTLPVEVYGFGWEDNPIVSPFFKGEIKSDQKLPRLYNSARFALINHAFEISSRHLNEVSVCGAIPVVYDCQLIPEKPHWEKEILYYSSEQTLHSGLYKQLSQPSTTIANCFNYEKFTKKIIQEINNHLNQPIINEDEYLTTLK